jgi:hypothetical protein
MLIGNSTSRVIFTVLLGWAWFGFANAQPTEDRWKPLVPGYQVDTKTFKALTVDDGVNKGKRWVNAWVQWEDKEGETVRVRMGALCEDRTLQISEYAIVGTNGKETYGNQFKELPVVPNGQWEPVHSELCKLGKKWWKVW